MISNIRRFDELEIRTLSSAQPYLLRVAVDWTFDLFFPRDIVFLRPLHTPKGEGAVSGAVADDACPVSQPARNPVTVRPSRATVHNSRGLP